MTGHITLSDLVGHIQQTIEYEFEGNEYWVSAQITNVKKYEHNHRCYLQLEEYIQGRKVAQARAVFWANHYDEIAKFESLTHQKFQSGIEIICRVKVRFHKVYGLNLDITKIDVAHTLGTLELERKETLKRLVTENPDSILLRDGVYYTYNQQLPLPLSITHIALITAHNSDGQRDFLQELANNKHNYQYRVTEYTCTIQGNNAHKLIQEQLQLIEVSGVVYDAVAIIRGGGSQTDFKPFDNYDLVQKAALFPIPIFSGIGHDRNQSILDMMVRELKTPTKVASHFIDHNFEFDARIFRLKQRMHDLVAQQFSMAKDKLHHAKRMVRLSSPQAILDRGFAIVMHQDKIVTDPTRLHPEMEIQTILKDKIMDSTITKIKDDE